MENKIKKSRREKQLDKEIRELEQKKYDLEDQIWTLELKIAKLPSVVKARKNRKPNKYEKYFSQQLLEHTLPMAGLSDAFTKKSTEAKRIKFFKS